MFPGYFEHVNKKKPQERDNVLLSIVKIIVGWRLIFDRCVDEYIVGIQTWRGKYLDTEYN